MSFDPVSAVLDIGGKLIDRLWPDPAQAASAKLELLKMQQSGELQVIAGQLEINKAEAANSNLFVSGWRPSIGWICSAALAYQYLVRPLLPWFARLAGFEVPDMIGLDDNLWQLLMGMLGLGGLRSWEKSKGVAS